jgi:hypothetical protein
MRVHTERRENPGFFDNPRFLGADLGEAAEGAVGIVLTAFLHDKILSQFEKPLMGGAMKHANNSAGQLVSAAGTLVAAWGVERIARFVVSTGTAARLGAAGRIYAGAKGLSALVPGLSVDAQFPDFWPNLSLFGQAMGATAPPGASTPVPALSSGGGAPDVFTDNPRPVAAGSDVGW